MKTDRIVGVDGKISYWDYDKLHREDGPAVIYPNGDKIWCMNNQIHRLDGPAIERVGDEKQWWINGKQINCETQKEFERLLKMKAFW